MPSVESWRMPLAVGWTSVSVIAKIRRERALSSLAALLPFAALQAEPRYHDRCQQKRHHRGGDRRVFAEIAAENCALIGERRHEVRRVDGTTARHRPDQLEVGEGE